MVWPPATLSVAHVNGETIVPGTDNAQAQAINDIVSHVVAAEAALATLGSSTGLLAARPAASAVTSGSFYLATDVNGGTLYRSDGATWSQAAAGVLETGGRELGRTDVGADFVLTGTTAATDYTGMSVPVTVGARPVCIIVEIPLFFVTAADGYVIVAIYEGATLLQAAYTTAIRSGGTAYGNFRFERTLSPSLGAHTYKAKITLQSGTQAFTASSLANFFYPSISVVER